MIWSLKTTVLKHAAGLQCCVKWGKKEGGWNQTVICPGTKTTEALIQWVCGELVTMETKMP